LFVLSTRSISSADDVLENETSHCNPFSTCSHTQTRAHKWPVWQFGVFWEAISDNKKFCFEVERLIWDSFVGFLYDCVGWMGGGGGGTSIGVVTIGFLPALSAH